MEPGKIRAFLENIKDDRSELEKCVEMLYSLQRDRGPVLEVVTIIRCEKPLLHSILKKRLRSKLSLSILFDLAMDYEVAKNKLK